MGEGRKQQAGESSAILENLDNGVVTCFLTEYQVRDRGERSKQRKAGWRILVGAGGGGPSSSLTQHLTSASRNRGSITSLSTCSSKWISS